MKVTYVSSTDHSYMVEREVKTSPCSREELLELTGEKKQTVLGFGGCFNELGWDALQKASAENRNAFIKELYCDDGCNFNMGRLPIGANDFSLEWYSCDETPDDYELKHFNIERDKQYTIPFIKEAMEYKPDLYLFASPWSPPTWMKTKRAYNYGRIRMEEKVLDAYARYFAKFVKMYGEEGVKIHQVHVQNEPMADQKFPSCLWYGEDMRDFIKNHLGPVFEKESPDTEIWLGTINGPFIDYRGFNGPEKFYEFYDGFGNTVLSDKEARKYISGVGVQWGGKHQLLQIHDSFPEMRVMQTESECGNGKNEWEQAEYIFTQMWYYFRHGAERYTYWNIALPADSESTWGWKQNSLCTVDESTGELVRQPEFYLMKHFSHYVKPGAKVLETKGHWTGNTVAFENPDGEIILEVGNAMNQDREFTFSHHKGCFAAVIPARSINTFRIEL